MNFTKKKGVCSRRIQCRWFKVRINLLKIYVWSVLLFLLPYGSDTRTMDKMIVLHSKCSAVGEYWVGPNQGQILDGKNPKKSEAYLARCKVEKLWWLKGGRFIWVKQYVFNENYRKDVNNSKERCCSSVFTKNSKPYVLISQNQSTVPVKPRGCTGRRVRDFHPREIVPQRTGVYATNATRIQNDQLGQRNSNTVYKSVSRSFMVRGRVDRFRNIHLYFTLFFHFLPHSHIVVFVIKIWIFEIRWNLF